MKFRWYGLNRTICSVFDDMRKAHETRNYSILMSLIEEAQTMANRMEAALGDLHDLEGLHEDIRKLRKELKDLEYEKENRRPKDLD